MFGIGTLIATHIPWFIVAVLGFAFLVIEMYIPGFGLPGITGIVLLTVGIMGLEPTALQAAILALICLILLGIALIIMMRCMRNGRLAHSKLILNETVSEPVPENETSTDLRAHIGKTGITHTALHPAGIAVIDGIRVDVVSAGDFIPAGTRVKVTGTDSNRVLVTPAK